jgi:hypothetical protein
LLKPHNAPVDLPVFTQLETANARIDAVYFVKDGFASVLADGPGKRNIEVGPHRSGKAKWPTAATFLPTTQGWLRRGRKVRGLFSQQVEKMKSLLSPMQISAVRGRPL